MFTALVMAGDRSGSDPHAGDIPGRKALLQISGTPMLDYVLTALRGARQIGDVFVVANRVQEIKAGLGAGQRGTKKVRFLEGAGSPVSSAQITLEKLKLPFPVLILTADNPLLRADDIDDFCVRSLAEGGATVTVAMAERSKFQALHPGVKRTFIPLKGESYKGCNMFAMLGPDAMKGIRFWLKVEQDRKSAFNIAAAFGFRALLSFVFRTLNLGQAFQKGSKVIGIAIHPLIVRDPRLVMDVDKPAHAALVEKILAERAGS